MTIQEALERAMHLVWEETGEVPTGISLTPGMFRRFEASFDWRVAGLKDHPDRDTIIWNTEVGTFKVTRDLDKTTR